MEVDKTRSHDLANGHSPDMSTDTGPVLSAVGMLTYLLRQVTEMGDQPEKTEGCVWKLTPEDIAKSLLSKRRSRPPEE